MEGQAGDFKVQVVQKPRYVDLSKCIACGICAEKCPSKVDDEFNQGLAKRKAIYVQYPQAVPLKYAIDKENCIYFKKGKCKACEKFCQAGAINFEDKEKEFTLEVGAVILAPGFRTFDPSQYTTYYYANFPNVITSLEFERILSASGPTMGHLVRPSDHKEPTKIAWLQCVGSRDINRCDHGYCSAVCCMYAIKEAVISKEHAGEDLDCAIFFMDMRTHGKEFEKYYDAAKNKQGVRFIRSRIHSIDQVKDGTDLIIRYATEDGEVKEEIFDMVVLSVGLETSPEVYNLAQNLGVDLSIGGFADTESFRPVATKIPGIYVCGAFQGPKDIPQTVIEASSAAAEAGALLKESRNTLTKTKEIPPERNVYGERPKIGVFVCNCGINIGGVVDVPAVRDYASTLPYVEFVTDNLYSCSQDTQDVMAKLIREKGLNRIVVAACSPKTHEPLFQETLVNAGLNKYLFEMVNIRNQDSWVHKDDPKAATEKAMDLVRMAVAKVAMMEPLREAQLEINQRALVIGGGVSGMVAAKTFSQQGYQVSLVERENVLGGQARRLYRSWKGEDVQKKLNELIKSVEEDPNIEIHLGAQITNVDGFVGNFKTTVKKGNSDQVIEHGVALIATGAKEYVPNEYLYGQDKRVLTHLELDEKFIKDEASLKDIKSAVFIQCVGSREPGRMYCSRVCCTHSVESALKIKEINPSADVYILYRDIRTYGEREYLYRKAREKGVIFIRFSLNNKPQVLSAQNGIHVTVIDHVLQRPVKIVADLLTLATAIVPEKDEALAQYFKVPMNEDGFFVEAHAKLGPSQFATDGVFLAGLAHYPKPLDESVAQAQAATSRAVTLLARKQIFVSGQVAQVNPFFCSSCGVCVEICPYSAPGFIEKGPFQGRAEVNPVLCKGCGLCVASCRSGAINLKGFGEDQIMAMINEL